MSKAMKLRLFPRMAPDNKCRTKMNYEVTIDNQVTKSYETLEQANLVYDRAVRLIRAKQVKYDCCQVIEYIAVWSNKSQDFLTYCDGTKLMDSVIRMGK